MRPQAGGSSRTPYLKAAVKCVDGAALLLGHQLRKHGGVVGAAPAAGGSGGERQTRESLWMYDVKGAVALPCSRRRIWARKTVQRVSSNRPHLMDSPKANSTMPYTLVWWSAATAGRPAGHRKWQPPVSAGD